MHADGQFVDMPPKQSDMSADYNECMGIVHEAVNVGIVSRDVCLIDTVSMTIRKQFGDMAVRWIVRGGKEAVALCLIAQSCPRVLLVDVGREHRHRLDDCHMMYHAIQSVPIVGVAGSFCADSLQWRVQNPMQTCVCATDGYQLIQAVCVAASCRQARNNTSRLWSCAPPINDDTDQTQRTCISMTRREQDILNLIVEGMSNSDIAVNLRISVATVKTHLVRIGRKLDARNRTQLAALWSSRRSDIV